MVSNVENLNPQLMRILAKEVQNLKQEPLEGIHILLDDKDITSVEAILEGPTDTPYFGGRFRVKLSIGKDFPASPPLGNLCKIIRESTKKNIHPLPFFHGSRIIFS